MRIIHCAMNQTFATQVKATFATTPTFSSTLVFKFFISNNFPECHENHISVTIDSSFLEKKLCSYGGKHKILHSSSVFSSCDQRGRMKHFIVFILFFTTATCANILAILPEPFYRFEDIK